MKTDPQGPGVALVVLDTAVGERPDAQRSVRRPVPPDCPKDGLSLSADPKMTDPRIQFARGLSVLDLGVRIRCLAVFRLVGMGHGCSGHCHSSKPGFAQGSELDWPSCGGSGEFEVPGAPNFDGGLIVENAPTDADVSALLFGGTRTPLISIECI